MFGLRVEELTGAELGAATALRRTHRLLSLPDAFAFALAESRGWAVLCGDGELRALARAQKLTCHGVLWVLDSLHAQSVAKPSVLLTGLKIMADHPRGRLPRSEVQARLETFAQACGVDLEA